MKALQSLCRALVGADESKQQVAGEDASTHWRIRLPGIPKATAGLMLALFLGFLLTEYFNPGLFIMKPGPRALFQPWRVFTQALVTTTPLGVIAALAATWWSVGLLEEDRGSRQALYFVLGGAVTGGIVGFVLKGVQGPTTIVFAALGALVWTRLNTGVRLNEHRQLQGTTLAALLLGSTVLVSAAQGLGPLLSVWAAVVAGAWCARQAGDVVCVVARTYEQPVPQWLDQRAGRVDVALQEHDVHDVAQRLKTQLSDEVRVIREARFIREAPPQFSELASLRCLQCGEPTSPTDRFCVACGAYQAPAEPSPPRAARTASLAFKVLVGLAIYGVVGGVIAFAVIHHRQEPLVEAAASPVDDALTTVQKRRIIEENERRQWFFRKRALLVLGVNVLVGLLMLGLAFWSKRAPLPALFVASATYLVVTVVSILQNPAAAPLAWIERVVVVAILVVAFRRTYVMGPRAVP